MLRPRPLACEDSCVSQAQHLAYIQTLRLPERWLLRWNQGSLWVSTHPNAGLLYAVSGRSCIYSQQVQATPDHK